MGAWFGEDKFGTANGNRTRILALKGLRANRCTIAALLRELQPINYTENFDFALRSARCDSDFGTTKDAGERRVDLGRILTPWPVATGGAIFRQVCYE
jgi:hypothetical protein